MNRFKLLKQIPNEHFFFLDNNNGLIVIADQSCINRDQQVNPKWAEHELLYVICLPLLTQLYDHIESSDALEGHVRKIDSVSYPVYTEDGVKDFSVFLTPEEVKWLYGYFNDGLEN